MASVLVCGGRDYENARYLYGYLDCFHEVVVISHLIEGGAPEVSMFV